MKKLILLGISCVLLQTISYAQENTEDTLFRQVVIFTELDSGSIVSDTDQVVKKANSLELGLEYKHNFAKVPWLSWFMKGTIIGKITTAFVNTSEGERDDHIVYPNWEYNGITGAGLSLGYFESGIKFDKYGYISLRGTTTEFLIKAYAYAPIEFGVGGTLSFLGGIEANPYQVGALTVGGGELPAKDASIKVLAIGMNYNIMFHENWGFNTELQYRTDGASTANRTDSNFWEFDSLDALKNNSSFRFDNTLKFKSDKLDVWFQVRYHPKYFVRVPVPAQLRRARTQHDVHIRAGVSYAFDIATLL